MLWTEPLAEVDPYVRSASEFCDPPQGWRATLRHLGPGMILVGAIVGSGELILTMKLGAEAGYVLLWFVLLSCVIKVVVQVELARLTISSGRTFLEVFNSLPGPRWDRPAWLSLSCLVSVVAVSFLALASYTLWLQRESNGVAWTTAFGSSALVLTAAVVFAFFVWESRRRAAARRLPGADGSADTVPQLSWYMWFWMGSYLLIFLNGGAIVGGAGQSLQMALPELFGDGGAKYWAVLVALLCGVMLLSGRYAVLERISIGLVASFTLITVICTALLQLTSYAIRPGDLSAGLTLNFPGTMTPVLVLLAMSMYANTGVTGNEMISYTYWCLEKGYAHNTGVRQEDEAWARRARGWIRVMYIDALLTMVVYTVSTVCFYLLGAAILHAKGLNPEGTATLVTLGDVYTETLGGWAATLFVVGSFFVLFSTTFSNVAAHSRILTDGLAVIGLVQLDDYQSRLRCIRVLVVVLLIAFVSAYSFFENPPMMLIVASLYTVVLYPVLGIGALYVRYRLIDRRVVAGPLTTGLLWVCGLALAIISPATLLLALLIRQGWLL